MQRPLAIGRIVSAVVAIILFAITAYHGVQCPQRLRDFDEWLVARPMELQLDLSQPGTYRVPFKQTCGISHGESICIELDPPPSGKQELEEMIKGLEMNIRIIDSDGRTVEERFFMGWQARDQPEQPPWRLMGIAPFRKGEYTAVVDVVQGAPALAGRAQTVSARYELCGLEQLPGYICLLFTLAAGLPALIVGLLTFVQYWRFGWRAAPARNRFQWSDLGWSEVQAVRENP